MKRRGFLSARTGGLLAAPLTAGAQPAREGIAPPDTQTPLLLFAFLFVVVVLFVLCSGLLMLVFRRVRPLKSGSPERGPRIRLPGELSDEAIAHEESPPRPRRVARGADAPRSGEPPDAGDGDSSRRGGRRA
jgi:hypothetical protein